MRLRNGKRGKGGRGREKEGRRDNHKIKITNNNKKMLNFLKENVAMLDDYINASQQIYCDKRVEVQRYLLHQKVYY